MRDLRSELLDAAHHYCAVEPHTKEVVLAWQKMVDADSRYRADGFDDDPGPACYAIGDYIDANEVNEDDYLHLEEILARPICGKCSADGFTVHHADSTQSAPIWQCAKCGHIGFD